MLEADDDGEVDLASRAFQIWKNATGGDPTLANRVTDLPPVVFSARAHDVSAQKPAGVIVYTRTVDGTDALTWVDANGQPVTQSPVAILQAAECGPLSQRITMPWSTPPSGTLLRTCGDLPRAGNSARERVRGDAFTSASGNTPCSTTARCS